MSVERIIDVFKLKLNSLRRELFVSAAVVQLGGQALAHPQNRPGSVSLRVAADTVSEPYPVDVLLPHMGIIKNVVCELFQGKIISAWHDLLDELYEFLIREHFDGRRQFPEAKKIKPEVNLQATQSWQEQVLKSAVDNFGFLEYGDRVKPINLTLNPAGENTEQFALILKHVHIRNAVQHHSSKVNENMQRKLGRDEIELLDDQCDKRRFALHDFIEISIPEIEALYRALWLLTNVWRRNGV
ncbi:hypothetical protein [Burkholderia vietnamiensis]|uniref:hypothetical protein n=1 Tax=Burkholderia vietnamiensis TaxID=60552 RepID=UPI001592BA52|nr:hypothetical protein [Burkholderia vietnamiensis]